uniref:GST C-terminal domain-containing protein n=1 Tax=Aureoumbra lagunensis TaxID=44058 RepID=A0A7S3JX88_9STRA|mmetsp:Transcript_19687/g.25494  ORF Transcript_19687/g.25494 Transcript_19687/m.25494 type:complete len:256 (+) Transcript_19687:116-883(+)|eukprot:CAMPEP_0197285288 /NCGR_PEP_ID=MMETSP0890-20130614/506_1 /TAXON_ID=44058 ORGANISM="Aureoumbra lagunensis, Strain CCMP1510" /NCGR_SAMPLE_ID=MMETSP0890 /ASSEMBLY_ACC=CAM_ASM_000533 /LENGTH=255 /DNA_ID=CAMNT_0042752635 /DNA_START=113 /DNA_END=880 /DNA_ORIENTATION=+
MAAKEETKKLQLGVFANDEEHDTVQNGSSFCTKLELYCLVAGIPFEKPILKAGEMGPRGKMPFAIFPSGEIVPDSAKIIEKLQGDDTSNNIDAQLTPDQLVISRLLITTLEESLYFVLVYFAWQDEANWPKTKASFFGGVPWFLRGTISRGARKSLVKALHGQGMGRRPEEEIVSIAKQIIDDTSFLLGERKNLFNTEKLTLADIVLYSMLEQFAYKDLPNNPVGEYLKTKANLMAFTDAVSSEYFPKIHANRNK